MPVSKYLKLIIGDKEVQITNPEELPVSIDYALEDPKNFQDKKSAEVLSIRVPATLMNDAAANTFRNPDIVDATVDQIFRSNQPFTIDENGVEIMKGKAFLNDADHDTKPIDYEYDLYGDNADWKIDLEEATLYDFLQHLQFIFSKQQMINSWQFDGMNEALPYVFAPVKYRAPFGGYTNSDTGERVADNAKTEPYYLRPSISKYWILYWAFKSVGYRIQSTFLSLPYFRRQVMPWTWGNFLSSEGTKFDQHRFRAKTEGGPFNINNTSTGGYILWDLKVSNDYKDGMYDNNNDYEYLAGEKMPEWTYNTPDYGPLDATFSCTLNYTAYAGNNCDIRVQLHWYKNGVNIQIDQMVDISAPGVQVAALRAADNITAFCTTSVSQGDIITARFYVDVFSSKINSGVWIEATVDQLQIDYFRIPLGGNIDFSNYTGFKKYKFLDYLRGILDEFNLSINTDPINKAVLIEPTHAYSVTADLNQKLQGYFVDDHLDWNDKKDLSKKWKLQNYHDYDRELTFKYKNDNNDGILKVVQDRNINTVAAGKYVFPARFKTGKDAIENRFFAATMHYDAKQWEGITGKAPQLVCLIPENISNTSNSESANTFTPKSCYYKGLVSGAGGWNFDGNDMTTLPFMFAVNYQPGGEHDPVLSYSDEKISNGSGGFVVAPGLLKRFYWQRLAIMRNGQFYKTFFRLNNYDVANQFHREHISMGGHKWELVTITGYRPLQELSTSCFLRRWAPVMQVDFDNTFPSAGNILNDVISNSFDIKYAQLKGLISDIPST